MTEAASRKLTSVLDLLTLLELGAVCVLVVLGLSAAAVILRALLPASGPAADEALARHTAGRRLLIGALNGPVALVVGVWLLSRHGWGWLGLLLLAALLGVLLAGLGAELPRLGRRILERADAAGGRLGATAAGGGSLALAQLVPFAGQLLAAGVFLVAIGTGVSALAGRWR